jgi:zinc protease
MFRANSRFLGLTALVCATFSKAAFATVVIVPEVVGTFQKKAVHKPLPQLVIYEYKNTKNGLTVFLSTTPATGVAMIATAYQVGSRYEVNNKTGLAHLFEHMMFRETKNFPEISKTFASWGEGANASTSHDVTVYHELVPVEVFDEALRLEADRMRHLQITEEVFNTERGAVVSERKLRTEDAPMGRLYWELYQYAFDKHPYKTGPIGWQEDLDSLSREDALAFYKRYYAPNRASMAIVGDFDIGKTLKTLDRFFGKFESEPWVEPEVPLDSARTANRRATVGLKTESVLLAHAVQGLTFKQSETAAESLYCTLLSDESLGYLANELVDKKRVARSMFSDCSPNIDPGLSALLVIGNPKVAEKKLESAFDESLKGFKKWMSESRLNNLKLYYLAAKWDALRSPSQLAEQLAVDHATTGNALYGFEFLEQVQKTTLADVLARHKAWQQARSTRVLVVPAEQNAPFERRQYKLEQKK